ncbi:hypothetical protein D9757_003862 [Collybiopsis confluens]|uniref:NAD(P)-binding protein n=1 Tax=Collybiopsis confluens TaxID=2823264 RepID=A0A8H5HV72_9AGAR|nr:hypothetical protein D9757_003862 [Collybiopsis confluens]
MVRQLEADILATPSKGVALVTGAAQGMGKDIALRLASDGYDVAINDLPNKLELLKEVQSQIEATGKKSTILTADISIESKVKEMVESTVSQLGSLEVMVSNAGICTTKSMLEVDAEEWDRFFAINTRGTFLCYKYAAIQMIHQGRGGRIIGASSIASKRGWEMGSAYSGSKFAVRGLTQSAASELGRYGITVNTYAPGFIDTPMLADAANSVASGADRAVADKAWAGMAPLNRIGQTADVAGLVSFLASSESSFITGQSVSVVYSRRSPLRVIFS